LFLLILSSRHGGVWRVEGKNQTDQQIKDVAKEDVWPLLAMTREITQQCVKILLYDWVPS